MTNSSIIGYCVENDASFRTERITKLCATHNNALRDIITAVIMGVSKNPDITITERLLSSGATCFKAEINKSDVDFAQKVIQKIWQDYIRREKLALPPGLCYNEPQFALTLRARG